MTFSPLLSFIFGYLMIKKSLLPHIPLIYNILIYKYKEEKDKKDKKVISDLLDPRHTRPFYYHGVDLK